LVHCCHNDNIPEGAIMNQFHIGRGTTRGALTVFPIWAEVAYPASYAMDPSLARIGERPDGPSVGSLTVMNAGPVPLLLLEGQLLEGGLQHRMVARSTLLAAGAQVPLDVMCVEQGRWSGSSGHTARARRVSTRVRAGLRTPEGQREVLRRVAEYDGRLGENRTSSYVEHANRAEKRLRDLVQGLRSFPGQTGVLIGLAGQPLTAEIFDTPRGLAQQYDEIVRAAAMDALGLPEIETPGRRARRFMDRAAQVAPQPVGAAGIAEAVIGRTEYVDLSAVRWHGHALYQLLTNPRHELVLAA
jgi:hypothetical protein